MTSQYEKHRKAVKLAETELRKAKYQYLEYLKSTIRSVLPDATSITIQGYDDDNQALSGWLGVGSPDQIVDFILFCVSRQLEDCMIDLYIKEKDLYITDGNVHIKLVLSATE